MTVRHFPYAWRRSPGAHDRLVSRRQDDIRGPASGRDGDSPYALSRCICGRGGRLRIAVSRSDLNPTAPGGTTRRTSPVLAAGVVCPGRVHWKQQECGGYPEKNQYPGVQYPSVKDCSDTFHTDPTSSRVAFTPSYSGLVIGGTGLPVFA